jgi:hypothetical protein
MDFEIPMPVKAKVMIMRIFFLFAFFIASSASLFHEEQFRGQKEYFFSAIQNVSEAIVFIQKSYSKPFAAQKSSFSRLNYLLGPIWALAQREQKSFASYFSFRKRQWLCVYLL